MFWKKVYGKWLPQRPMSTSGLASLFEWTNLSNKMNILEALEK